LTITNGYCLLTELKADERLKIVVSTYDASLEGVIEAVSRAIDNECSRFFWKDTNDTTNYFVAENSKYIYIGDYVSITTLSMDGNGDRDYIAWTVDTDFDLWPYNAALDGKPYMRIDTGPRGTKNFYTGISKGIKIVGKRGWPAVPKPIKEACLIWSERTYERYKTPLGVSATTALGEMTVKVPPPDVDVMTMLNPYRLNVFS